MAVPEKLERALKAAYSYENRTGHEADEYETWYIGSIEKNNRRIYELYQDSNGSYWYKVYYRLPDGQKITETESVFGHKLTKGKKYLENSINPV